MRILISKITSIFSILILLTTQAPQVYAVYSPTLSQEVSEIKGHVQTAESQNGVGDFWQAWEKVSQRNVALQEEGKAFGTPGLFVLFWENVKAITINSLFALGEAGAQSGAGSFLDSFAYFFGSFLELPGSSITTCLRDDLWELQALQEAILNELFKSGLLNDTDNTKILWKDYLHLKGRVEDLRNEPEFTEKWFFTDQDNLYVDCPYGEFTQAIDELLRSLERFQNNILLKTLKTGGFSEMWAEAEKRAVRRAAKWFAANQLSLTFGGPKGANPRSLTKGPGLEQLGAEFKTSKSLFDDYVESIEPVFSTDDDSAERVLEAYEKAREKKELTRERVENAITFNLQLNNVEDESLKAVDRIMARINLKIQEALGSDKDADLLGVCKNLNTIVKTQCKNKSGGTAPACK